jgi:phenylpropionate dioxygenase-like ring-hydroxylating dioxygenase large terminal subunit
MAYSSELPAKGVLPVRFFGEDLVLFRTESGEAKVLDAYCAHLGAHLGHGGVVEGDCIKCPFHAWKYDGTGQCTHIPYAQKIPARAKVRAWPVVEKNGFVLAWYHADGDAPSWEVPRIEEYYSDAYTPFQDFRLKLKTHIQETAENAVDTAHLNVVHEVIGPKGTITKNDGVDFHVHVDITAQMMKGAGTMKGTIDMEMYGLGITPARVNVGPISYLFLTTVTPIDTEYLDARFIVSLKKFPAEDVTKMILGRILEDEEQQVRRDIPIWENKIYPNPPLICDGDGPIGPFRRWAKQFYSRWEETLDATALG